MDGKPETVAEVLFNQPRGEIEEVKQRKKNEPYRMCMCTSQRANVDLAERDDSRDTSRNVQSVESSSRANGPELDAVRLK